MYLLISKQWKKFLHQDIWIWVKYTFDFVVFFYFELFLLPDSCVGANREIFAFVHENESLIIKSSRSMENHLVRGSLRYDTGAVVLTPGYIPG